MPISTGLKRLTRIYGHWPSRIPPTYGVISLEKDIALLQLRSLLKLNYLSLLSAVLGFVAVQATSFILACKM
eukprot:10382181-Ditylum_brightwellii.AAC.1